MVDELQIRVKNLQPTVRELVIQTNVRYDFYTLIIFIAINSSKSNFYKKLTVDLMYISGTPMVGLCQTCK